jgi:hypothetical protein
METSSFDGWISKTSGEREALKEYLSQILIACLTDAGESAFLDVAASVGVGLDSGQKVNSMLALGSGGNPLGG